MKRALAVCVLIMQLFSLRAQEDTIALQMLLVSTSRAPVTYADASRLVAVIPSETIQAAPVQSLGDLLEYLGSVDIRQRGPLGVQSDVSIRGGSFEQALILLNGVKVSDPQTGHFGLNVPIDLQQVERIEILEGPGARIYGPNAFSGAINIITRQTSENWGSAGLTAGEYGYMQLSAGAGFVSSGWSNQVMVSRQTSDGYRPNTDFQGNTVYYNSRLINHIGQFDAQWGYMEKAFGANSFYTPVYPAQYEANKSSVASLSFQTNGRVKMRSVAYWRWHKDRFELFRNEAPSWYTAHNYHVTNVAGAEWNATVPWKAGKTSLGLDYRHEQILSNKLGEPLKDTIDVRGEASGYYCKGDSRENLSVFLEHQYINRRFSFSGGGLAYWNSAYSWNSYAGAEAGWRFARRFRGFASVNESLRLPTFTELYYQSPTILGNTALLAEKAVTIEGGVMYQGSAVQGHVAIFQRYGRNMIDWVRLSGDEPWVAENHTEINTFGAEASCLLALSALNRGLPVLTLRSVSMSYSWLNQWKQSDTYQSKYILDYLRHKAVLSVTHTFTKALSLNWLLTYQERAGTYSTYDPTALAYTGEVPYKPVLLVDARLTYTLKRLGINVFCEASNLGNRNYFDTGNVPQAGRWVRAGIILRHKF